LVFGAETVGKPTSHARPSRDLKSGLEKRDGGIVIDRIGVHRVDEAEIVHDVGGVREKFAEPDAGLAVLGEFEDARRDGKLGLVGGHSGEALAHSY